MGKYEGTWNTSKVCNNERGSALEYIFYYFHEVLVIESGRITSEWNCVGCRCVTWKGANTEL